MRDEVSERRRAGGRARRHGTHNVHDVAGQVLEFGHPHLLAPFSLAPGRDVLADLDEVASVAVAPSPKRPLRVLDKDQATILTRMPTDVRSNAVSPCHVPFESRLPGDPVLGRERDGDFLADHLVCRLTIHGLGTGRQDVTMPFSSTRKIA